MGDVGTWWRLTNDAFPSVLQAKGQVDSSSLGAPNDLPCLLNIAPPRALLPPLPLSSVSKIKLCLISKPCQAGVGSRNPGMPEPFLPWEFTVQLR